MALKGVMVVELAGLAPAPYCGLLLSDFGATVIRVDKPGEGEGADTLGRGKKSICLDLKNEVQKSIFLKLIQKADVLIDPYRPNVLSKLGLSPSTLTQTNPRLIYVRLTGYGVDGPMALKAGHDINYISLSGVLSCIRGDGEEERPIPPVNLMGDFAGGGMAAALGTLLALWERNQSGLGQVVDANMIDGSAHLATFLFKGRHSGVISRPPGRGMLDGGAFFYSTYRTKDDKWISIGAIEPQFFAELIDGMGIPPETISQYDTERWAEWKLKFKDIFKSKTLEQWEEIFRDRDACFTPVLDLEEVMQHPHNKSRSTLSLNDQGYYEPPAVPRLSRTTGRMSLTDCLNPSIGQHTREILREMLHMKDDEISRALSVPSRL